MHGGRSPRGTEHPNWKGRGYSVDLPTRLYDRYQAGLNDPELSSCKNELALIDSRLGDLFTSRRSSRTFWREVYGLIDLRRKVANAEHRREGVMQQHLTIEQATALIGCLLALIRQEQTEVQHRLSSGLRAMLPRFGLAPGEQVSEPPPEQP